MSKRKGTVLIVDDEEEIRESIELLLNSEGLSTDTAAAGEDGLKKIEDNLYDAVLLDLMLPGKSGMEIQKDIKRIDPTLPIVIITAIGALETAVTAIKEGSFDYVTKPWNNEKLIVIVNNAIKQRQLMSENLQLRRALKQRFGYSNIIGKSEKIQKVLDLVTQVAASRSTVLIQGESGTGKELIAKAIHLKSQRVDRTFVPVNSGSMPVDLLESTLFGHVRGAFTSAIASKKGLFEVADQGTIFFDEIGTISMETQAKLLRVLQEREFMRLGGIETIKVDARIIAATNVDLKRLVEEGRFREDLYYRLNVINIQLPPLRDRKEDVPLLVEHFLVQISAEAGNERKVYAPEAVELLVASHWPGNVRQLYNVVRQNVALSPTRVISAEQVRSALGEQANALPSFSEARDEFTRNYLSQLLQITGGNVSQAARLAKRNRTDFYKLLGRHQLNPEQFKDG